MKRSVIVALYCCLVSAFGCSFASSEPPSAPPPVTCDRGPIYRNFGGTWWFVYACTDNESLGLVSLPYNPACPYHFVISRTSDGKYTVNGFGNDGEKTIPDVKKELDALTEREIASLVSEANTVVK